MADVNGSSTAAATSATAGAEGGGGSGSKPPSKKHNKPKPKKTLTPRQVETAATKSVTGQSSKAESSQLASSSTAPPKGQKAKSNKRTPKEQPQKASLEGNNEPATAEKTSKKPKKPKPKNGKKREGEEGADAKSKSGRWWASLKDVDPITLAPLSSLKEPPFELVDANTGIAHHFDTKALAIYLLSTGKFVDPINRQDMTREDCLRLDDHLKRYGMAEHARCTDMLDLQKTIKLNPESAPSEGALNSLRQEAGVIAAHLFHYPSVRGRRTDTRSNPSAGAMNVTDMDEQWQTTLPSTAEEQFPVMPSARRRVGEEEFPELRPTSAGGTESSTRSTQPSVPSASWASVAETSRTRVINIPAPSSQTTETAGGSDLSWRNRAERPRWDFVWLGEAVRSDATQHSARSQAVFGNATPVDNSRFLSGTSFSRAQAPSLSAEYLCPYLPRMLKAAKTFGGTWIGTVERRLKEVVDAGTSRKVVQFEPMPEARRKLLQEIAIKFWGLHAVERDPEPHRFLEVSALPGSFTPDMTLQRAMMMFPDLASTEFFSTNTSSSGIAFIGCPYSTSSQRVHDLMRNVAQARESEYDVYMLDGIRPDEKNVYVDISSNERARKVFKRLSNATHDFRCRKMEWWPCGLEWAKSQIRNAQKSHVTEFQNVRAQRELDERRRRLAQTADAGWDDSSALDETRLEAVRARLAQQVDWDDDGEGEKEVVQKADGSQAASDSESGSSDSSEDSDSDSD